MSPCLSVEYDQVQHVLDLTLALTDDIQRAYRQAGPQERRLLNQGLLCGWKLIARK